MFTLENRVGRLVELRAQSPVTLEDLKTFHSKVVPIASRIQGNMIACSDLRGARVFPADVRDRITAIMRQENPRMERNAFLVGSSAVFSMQIERMIREVGSPQRETFHVTRDAEKWLSELLTPPEIARLREFVLEGTRFVLAMDRAPRG